MRKKFTYLISLAAAMICSSGGVAWGQEAGVYGYGTHNAPYSCQSPYITFGNSGFDYQSVASITYQSSCSGNSTSYGPGYSVKSWPNGVQQDVDGKAATGITINADKSEYQFLFRDVTFYGYWYEGKQTYAGSCSPSGSYNSVSWPHEKTYSTDQVREEIKSTGTYVRTDVSSSRTVTNASTLTHLTVTGGYLWVKGSYNNTGITITNGWDQKIGGTSAPEGMGVYGTIGTNVKTTGGIFALGAATTGQNLLTMTTTATGKNTLTSFYPATSSPYPSFPGVNVCEQDICYTDPNTLQQSIGSNMLVGATSTGVPTLTYSAGDFTIENRSQCCSNYLEFGSTLGGGMLTVGGTGTVNIANPNASIIFDAAETYPNTANLNIKTGGSYILGKEAFKFTGATGTKSLLIQASGACDGCGGYVAFRKDVTTENGTAGTTTIKSDHSAVAVHGKYLHTGNAGADSLLVKADTKVRFNNDVEIKRVSTSASTNTIEGAKIAVEGKTTYSDVNTTGGNHFYLHALRPFGQICAPFCDAGGADIDVGLNAGGWITLDKAVHTTNKGNSTSTIQSDGHYVLMNTGYKHEGETGNMLVSAGTSVDIKGDNVVITRTGNANDVIRGGVNIDNSDPAPLYEKQGHVYIEKELQYTQSGSITTPNTGLTVKASGEPCSSNCYAAYDANPGGYVSVLGKATTTNVLIGTSLIKSDQDSVSIRGGYQHTGVNGNMTVDGYTAVHIYGGDLNIIRNNTASGPTSADLIYSETGNILVSKNVIYNQATGAAAPEHNYSFTMLANGDNCSRYCPTLPTPTGPIKGGFLVVDGKVTITHKGDGETLLQSTADSVAIHNGYVYTGINGNNKITGYNGVELTGAVVTITRDPDGTVTNGVWDEILSDNGQIHVQKQFDYILGNTSTNAVNGGLLMQAKGNQNCLVELCNVNNKPKNYGGYIWFEDVVNTTADKAEGITPAQNEGTVEIHSYNHFVRMDKTYTHKAQNGNLLIEADGACAVDCDNNLMNNSAVKGSSFDFANGAASSGSAAHDGKDVYRSDGQLAGNVGVEEGFLVKGNNNSSYPLLTAAYNGRPDAYNNLTVSGKHYGGGGYVWIQGATDIDYSSNAASVQPEGDAKIKSAADIIQFDNTFHYIDKNGGNLFIDGFAGVRTLGQTTIERTKTDPTFPGAQEEAATVYNSEKGFIDFLAPFVYTGTNTTQNAYLQFLGNSRVEFNYDVAFDNSASSSRDILNPYPKTGIALRDSANRDGEVRVYSKAGWAEFLQKLEYKGYDGDFVVWAEGNGSNICDRSCIDSTHVCEDGKRAGYVHFNDKTSILYEKAPTNGVEGKVWIRSKYDDVKIDQDFDYNYSGASAADTCGMFVMQAGQDIYGISDGGLHEEPETTNAHAKKITFTQPARQPILLQAKKTVHIVQDLVFDKSSSENGDITISAGYTNFTDTANVNAINQYENEGFDWEKISDCSAIPNDYTSRFPCVSKEGGDIWFEGNVDLMKFNTNNNINTTLRAYNSIFIDQNFFYQQQKVNNTVDSANLFMFAHSGNIEAIDGSLDTNNPPTAQINSKPVGSLTQTSVYLNIVDPTNTSEIRMQAGNQADNENRLATFSPIDAVSGGYWPTGICMTNESCMNNWINSIGEYDGNILFNKPLTIDHNGLGFTMMSSSRDIENQVNSPFELDYTNPAIMDTILLTAGRHIENHSVVRFRFPDVNTNIGDPNGYQIVMQAGRLGDPTYGCNSDWCKANEEGTQLTELNDKTKPYDPIKVTTGNITTIDNEFSKGGKGQGSILMFDSVEFDYSGKAGILMTALNGNIESDPYLHRRTGDLQFNVVFPGNNGAGYDAMNNYHDAQLTFNHGGEGITRMEAIDIKLHDKVAYIATKTANNLNGEFYMAAFDSILTRNVEYRNHTDKGSVYITTDKIKDPQDCGDYKCNMGYHPAVGGGPGGIVQGHIVLGYGADKNMGEDGTNKSDSIVFEFSAFPTANANTAGANLFIQAGYLGFNKNKVNGKGNNNLFKESSGAYQGKYVTADQGKGYGGNITFDFMKVDMAKGNGTAGGYTEISTPNGNIWGKDSIQYHGMYGDLLVDAGLGSLEDTARAIRWNAYGVTCAGGTEKTLNTQVPTTCDVPGLWRTGNIIMKGGSLHFNDVSVNGYTTPSASGQPVGTGDAIFRTREGFIDTYDAFSVDSMSGDLLKYAGTLDATTEKTNEWGDISERDFFYTPVEKSGSIFYGADDNIMMNYGYSNYDKDEHADGFAYGGLGQYNIALKSGTTTALSELENPFYSTTYMPTYGDAEISGIKYHSVYNVNEDGYMWYRNHPEDEDGGRGSIVWKNGLHKLYRTCHDTPSGDASCSPTTGECKTVDNHARDLYFNFDVNSFGDDIQSGGLGVVAMNYIDMFTKFTYYGGEGSGMGTVPGMNTLHGEPVATNGLYIKSLSLADGTINSNVVEHRRATCEGCGVLTSRYMGAWDAGEALNHKDLETYEWTYIGFHDDARIFTQDQKGLIEAPVVEFFGHAELNPRLAPTNSSNNYGTGELKVKGDSLIFHDSAIFDGPNLELLPYTTDANRRSNDMRYGVINDKGGIKNNVKFYRVYGKAIEMVDRMQPVIEFGYQRCYEPTKPAWEAPNRRSMEDKESTPTVGGDIIVSCRNGYQFPIFNTVVANHARISFISDSIDGDGTPALNPTKNVVDAIVRTDLLRIRNNVEFYTGNFDNGNDNNSPSFRRGTLKMTPLASISSAHEAGIFPNHLHLEPGSELSLVGEDSLAVEPTTTVGGFGNLHENVTVKQTGTIAPGLASLMEGDCQTSYYQGKLTIHNLVMQQNAIFRISIGNDNLCYNEELMTNEWCTKTDTLVVEDTIQMWEKIYLRVLPKTEHIDEGCYLFLVYGDSTGSSKERVKNLVLDPNSLKYDDKYLGLDFSEPGKVYLCVSAFPMPEIQRYVTLPSVTGVTTTPNVGTHYVKGNQNFSFTASYAGAPLKVTAEGYYSHEVRDLDYTAVVQPDGSYLYTIYQVVEPWNVQIGPEASTVGNEAIDGQRVWAYKNTLHINVDKSDIVSIYNLTGVLYKKIEVPEGNSKFTLDRGMYVVTLKDGSVYKIVIK